MVLQSICCALAAFEFIDPIHRRQDSLNGGSARRKASTNTQHKAKQHKHT
jgi:hypothetical protein